MATLALPKSAESNRDLLLVRLNLFFAIAQLVVTVFMFSSGFNQPSELANDQFYNPNRRVPLILPADYTFVLWGVIFFGALAYATYQALPAQYANPLLQQIRPNTLLNRASL